MGLSRGFITVATGDYYCWLAQNLAMSYRLFSNPIYPLYVITDKAGQNILKDYFDGVIVLESPHYSFVDKIEVYYNSPFEETIFLDADMSIVKDISFIFDVFKQNGSCISCYGAIKDITEDEKPNHFGDAAVKRYNLKQFVQFGGGIYYFQKCETANKVIDFIFQYEIPHYEELDLLQIGGYFRDSPVKMADEPLMGLAMMVFNMKPVNTPEHFMRYYRYNMMETLKWDMMQQDLSFYWWGEIVHPYIAHYATYNTFRYKYYRIVAKLNCLYNHTPAILTPFTYFKYDILWLLSDNTKKEMKQWIKSHFSFEYVKFTFDRVRGRKKI